MHAKRIAKKWLPPVLIDLLKPVLKRSVYYSGCYEDWAEADSRSSGYDAAVILERVKQAMFKVKHGEAVFERDSVLFDKVQYSFPVLAALLHAAVEDDNQLSVLDFGGSLGSSYYQCRNFLSVIFRLQWSIVEQEHFVRCGQRCFEDEQLRFFYTIEECLEQISPNVVLLSSVLQYVQEAYQLLDKLMSIGAPYIVIDRTPFADIEVDFVTVQRVPRSIYAASYPCRVFARKPFLDRVSAHYKVLVEFDGNDGKASVGNLQFKFGGVILQKL